MGPERIVIIAVVLLSAALLAAPLAARLRLPYTALLILLGFVGSEIVVGLGFDTGIRAQDFHDLVIFVFVPVLVFEAAIRIDLSLLLRNLLPVLVLAIVVMMASAAVAAGLLYFGIGHPAGFPWIAAALTGVLLAATDPAAVVAQLESMGASPRLTMLLEGESLFNDATAIVLFGLLLALARDPAYMNNGADATLEFLRVFVGGIAVGVMAGGLGLLMLRWQPGGVMHALVSLLAAYGSYVGAESLLHVSGVMAVLLAGLTMGYGLRHDRTAQTLNGLHALWAFLGHLATTLVFLLVGVTITVAMFQERWLAMIIAIGAVLLARAACIFLTMPLLSLVMPQPVTLREQTVLVWGGLRGAVTLALALALPTELEYWWTIQSIAFGVVLFTMFVQAPTIAWLTTRLAVRGSGSTAAASDQPAE